MPEKGNRERGLSLVEVMVAMLILAIALVGLALAFPSAHLGVFQGRVTTEAVALAEQRLEIARNTPYAGLGTLAGTDSTTYSPYTVTTAVTVDSPGAGLTTVTANVTGPRIVGPNTPDQGPQSVVVETFIAAP